MVVYLDELPMDIEPLGLVLMRMMAANRDPEIRQLAQRAVDQSRAAQDVQTIKLVEMLLAYRYPQIGAEELAEMFTFSKEEIKQTKVYQEGALPERFRVILRLSQRGMNIEEIAAVVGMDPTEV